MIILMYLRVCVKECLLFHQPNKNIDLMAKLYSLYMFCCVHVLNCFSFEKAKMSVAT